MWAQLIKVASLSKGALVVGVAASAAMVSNAEFTNAPSHHEVPSASAVASVTPAASSRPASSPSSSVKPKVAEAPASPQITTQERHGAVPQVVKDCVDRYLAVRELGDSATSSDRVAVGEVCKAALTATGLSSGEFWAKFGINDEKKTEPKSEPKAPGLDAAIKECVSQYLAGTADRSDACRTAIAASGLSPQEFWTKFGPYADQAKGALSPEALHLAQECATKYTAKSADATATCKKAIELTGLTTAEFAARFLSHSTETKPAEPASKSKDTELYALIKECLRLRNALTSTSEQERVSAASAACGKAISTSGLTPDEFWTKVSKEPTATPTKPAATPKPVTNTADAAQLAAKCLDMYAAVKAAGVGDTKAVGEMCNAAITASGVSANDFWAKYHPATN